MHSGKWGEALQGADGGKNDEKLARLMTLKGVGWANPLGLKLLRLIGHRRLVLGHARHQKGHVEALGQIAVGDPVSQHVHLVRCQLQA